MKGISTYLSYITNNPFLLAKGLRFYIDGCYSMYREIKQEYFTSIENPISRFLVRMQGSA